MASAMASLPCEQTPVGGDSGGTPVADPVMPAGPRGVVLVDLEDEVGADLRAGLAPGAPGEQQRVAVAAGVDLVVVMTSTPGGQASMHRSHPLQASTSMTTVPRVVTVAASSRGRRHRLVVHAGARRLVSTAP